MKAKKINENGSGTLPRFFATTNPGKAKEVARIIKKDIKQIKIDFIEPQSMDIDVVARFKAEYAYKAVGEPVLVEDTSLEIEALNGLPGTLIKFFMDHLGNQGILDIIKDKKNRNATATTEFAFFDGEKCVTSKAKMKGTIPFSQRGDTKKGFGWDVIFVPAGSKKSYGEMTREEKSKCSMRGKALRDMIKLVGKNTR